MNLIKNYIIKIYIFLLKMIAPNYSNQAKKMKINQTDTKFVQKPVQKRMTHTSV